MDRKQPADIPEDNQQTIFSGEEFSLNKFERTIRHARYAMCGAPLTIVGLYLISNFEVENEWISIAILMLISCVFVGLALWSRKKPYTAIVIAFAIYLGLIVLYAIYNPGTIMQMIIFKIIIIVYLAKGINDAREWQRLSRVAQKPE
jgi:hypothetical protein